MMWSCCCLWGEGEQRCGTPNGHACPRGPSVLLRNIWPFPRLCRSSLNSPFQRTLRSRLESTVRKPNRQLTGGLCVAHIVAPRAERSAFGTRTIGERLQSTRAPPATVEVEQDAAAAAEALCTGRLANRRRGTRWCACLSLWSMQVLMGGGNTCQPSRMFPR